MEKVVFWTILDSKCYLHWSLMILFISFGCSNSGLKNNLFSNEDNNLFKNEISIAVELMIDSTLITPGVRGLTVLSINKYDTISNSFSFSIRYVCSKWDYYPLNLQGDYYWQEGRSIFLNFEDGFDEKLKAAIFRELYASRISRKEVERIGKVFETLENDFSNYEAPTLYVVVKDGKSIFAKYVVEPPTLKAADK